MSTKITVVSLAEKPKFSAKFGTETHEHQEIHLSCLHYNRFVQFRNLKGQNPNLRCPVPCLLQPYVQEYKDLLCLGLKQAMQEFWLPDSQQKVPNLHCLLDSC
eukprot:UN03771